ncbi:hypothetical protein [Roseibium sp.]|uniref:hypothetical protein n=1 Tax=Roseibium sp. TaxID=1936156 RepID=UPI0025F64BC9|nr:hypothetical protein [Roseibium sp.]
MDDRAIQEDTICANPDIVTNCDAAPARLKSLFQDQPTPVLKCVIDGSEGAIGGNGDIVTDRQAVPRIDHAAGIQSDLVPDEDVTLATDRFYLDETVNNRIYANSDHCATHTLFNVRQWGNFRSGINLEGHGALVLGLSSVIAQFCDVSFQHREYGFRE